jgi:hypothetical protein
VTTQVDLHDRATRGLQLSLAEQAQLEAWYAQQDEAEHQLLHTRAATLPTSVLQGQIKLALTQLATVTQRIQELTLQNEELRREVAALKLQLTQHLAAQAV